MLQNTSLKKEILLSVWIIWIIIMIQKSKRIVLKSSKRKKNFKYIKNDLVNYKFYNKLKKHYNDINSVIHLAGQAGVRYSIQNPETYIVNNILAYIKLLEFF